MFVQRFPGSLQQQRVAGSQNGLVRSLILACPLHRKDHQIAARRDHPGKH